MKSHWAPAAEDPPIDLDGRADRAYLELLIEHSPIAIVTLNSHHQAVQCNPAFEKMFGFTRSEIANRPFDDLIAAGVMLDEARQCTRLVLQGEKTHAVNWRRRKDGVWIYVEIHGIPLIIDGMLHGVYGLYVDITERTRAESSLRKLSLELMHLQETEKRRIARELHDATSQDLALLSISLSKLKSKLSAEDTEVAALVNSIHDLTRQCTQKIRTASYLLHPPLLEEAGLIPAISWLADGFAERVGIPVNVRISSKVGRLNEMAELALFRVLQESLSNVLRHSKSNLVDIRLSRRLKTVKLSVENRGASNLPARTGEVVRDGVGIAGMKERMMELGGHLDVLSTDYGTTVVASLPMEARADA
jgi:two-component system, NarL family, sensor kinase